MKKREKVSNIIQEAGITDINDLYHYGYLLNLNKYPYKTKRDKDNYTHNCWNHIRYNYYEDGWNTITRYPINMPNMARNIIGKEILGAKCFGNTRWIDLDIDHANGNINDNRIQIIQDIFNPESYLIQKRNLSGNFSVLFQCKDIHENRMHRLLTQYLNDNGLDVKKGYLEIFPSRSIGRRLPFGGRCEDIEVYKPHGYKIYNEWVNQEIPQTNNNKKQILDNFFTLNPLDVETLNKGKKYYVIQGNKKEESEIKTNIKKVKKLIIDFTYKLIAPSTRYDTEVKMIYRCYISGMNQDEAMTTCSKWYTDENTNGYSKEWKEDRERVLRNLRSHIRTYYAWLDAKQIKPIYIIKEKIKKMIGLSRKEYKKILKKVDYDLHYAETLYNLLLYMKERIKYKNHLFISHKVFHRFVHGSNYKEAMDKFIENGIVEVVNNTWEIGKRSKVFKINWNFIEDNRVINPKASFREAINYLKIDLHKLRSRYKRSKDENISRQTRRRIENIKVREDIETKQQNNKEEKSFKGKVLDRYVQNFVKNNDKVALERHDRLFDDSYKEPVRENIREIANKKPPDIFDLMPSG